jgi:hypothetical protein
MCNELYKVLEQVKAKRLVVGHTPQLRGVNEVCNGCAWRIDVGMSTGVLGASPQVKGAALARCRRSARPRSAAAASRRTHTYPPALQPPVQHTLPTPPSPSPNPPLAIRSWRSTRTRRARQW